METHIQQCSIKILQKHIAFGKTTILYWGGCDEDISDIVGELDANDKKVLRYL